MERSELIAETLIDEKMCNFTQCIPPLS